MNVLGLIYYSNIDDSIYNQVRELLFDIYTEILDGHIDTLHELRQNPDFARKYLKYQTKQQWVIIIRQQV